MGGAAGTVLRLSNGHWRKLQSSTQLDIQRLWGFPTGEVFAVASDEFNSFAGSLILRIEGDNIYQEQPFSVGIMFSVWGENRSNLYVTGEGTFKKMDEAIWAEVQTPNPRVALLSMSASKSNNLTIAGAYGAVIHWNGNTWKFYDALYDRSSFKSYFGAYVTAKKYFLVGGTGSHALVTVGRRDD